MAETDALKGFDFGKFGGGGTFLKFKAGEPVVIRVLTVDPVLNIDSKFGNTAFGFIVYNFTEGKAQILNASPGVAKRIQAIHFDQDFGANIRKIDLKISPEGEKLNRKYEIQVLPTAKELTPAMINEAKELDLEDIIGKNAGFTQRLSLYDQEEYNRKNKELNPDEEDGSPAPNDEDAPLDLSDDEPINLDDIPF